MGKYVSVRGWLECNESTLNEVKKIRNDFTANYNEGLLDEEKIGVISVWLDISGEAD